MSFFSILLIAMTPPNWKPPLISYREGALCLDFQGRVQLPKELSFLAWDDRQKQYLAHAYHYRELIRYLHLNSLGYTDSAPKYEHLDLEIKNPFTPHDYQQEALTAWERAKRGICVLPTGSGKSYLAAMAMEKINRATLILAPTIDLILQWQKNLQELFQVEIGLLGGGSREILPLTVSTYDSARIHAPALGNRFGLLIFDECHHLPAPGYAQMARGYIAPFRLGLTATPNEESERQELLGELTGGIVYHKQIQQLSGEYLAPYEARVIEVELSEAEREEYEWHRGEYMAYRDGMGENFSRPGAWERFVMRAHQTPEGREAMESFRKQKEIATSSAAKLESIAQLLHQHRGERVLIFTHDNKTAIRIASLFLLPLITHETKAKERKEILANFRSNRWPFLVNSRVLNEGVDVPEAGVAIVVSGSSTTREHVQRLGRILRNQKGKQAILYELVTAGTTEVYTSKRRREHGAYRGF